MTSPTELEQLRDEGYVVVPNAISSSTLTAVREQLDPYLQGEYPGRNEFEGLASERVYALLDKAPAVAELVANERILPLLDAVMETNYLLSACLAIQLHPGETAQAWHYDDAFVTIPLPRPSYSVSTIWAIDDFTADNGATEVIPGSHKWGAEATHDPDDAVVVEMPAGSAVVFLGTTLHRGGANRSAGDRLAITPQYCAPWARPQETFMLSVRREMAMRYSERVQQLLGYSIHPPFMGHADGRHPAKLLDPAFSDGTAGRRSAEFWDEWEGAGHHPSATP
ncbi:MAG: phytanoyl-CoA dioxygenase family protein [Ilumatobacter sp.]|uniref:phytanoyl-CoA dioxygenase family protein n=1 Tax=Ilumatobacter sp. TaxID=1967498 RepID=UPI002635ADD1|nr:phytanoyl-CoA dioxygenase family protein [Ilumatobacter sp.]MDJ0768993.1 phytanoyl-CoA dioxygenase family protein [Ilumatobacter sp.]